MRSFLANGPHWGSNSVAMFPMAICRKLTGHTLFRVGYIVIAVWKDAHAHETSGCSRSRSEVTRRESSSARVCLVENGERKRMEGSAQGVGAGGALVARIFVQKEPRKELCGLPGCAIGHFVSVESAKCVAAVLPFSWIVARRIEHLEAGSQCWQYHGWRAKGLVDVNLKLVSPR